MIETFDEIISYYIQKIFYNKTCMIKIMKFISAPFNLYNYIAITIILYNLNIITNHQIIILFYTMIILTVIKFSVRRIRPCNNNNLINKYGDLESFDIYSFPSGHVINSYLITAIIYKNFNINIMWLPYLVGFSRIYLGLHYLSDVIGGLIIGYIISLYL
jgi:undecaprenyl-diphosphatase